MIYFLMCPISLRSQTTLDLGSTVLTEREVAIGINVPWEILWGPDDHIWVTEKFGRVLRIEPTSGLTTTILDIANIIHVDSEPGLLGMTFHAEFESNPLVYLVYNYEQGFNIKERLVRYTWDGTSLINQEIILDNLDGGGIHNGSRLLFSMDGKILMTTGDVGSGNLSQDMSSPMGKLLRINPDGTIPEDNPDPSSYIWSYGHRNAQGLAYGPNDQLYSSEHGAQSSDEFNIIEKNRNYGWPNVQGECNTNVEMAFCEANNVKEPLIEFTPCVAVNGIEYYNHPAIPEWKGTMLMAVLGGFVQDARISVLRFNEDGTEIIGEDQFFDNYGRLRDLCINPHNGAVYFATNGNFYPSSGPNRIIEYRNLEYVPTSVPEALSTQNIQVTPNILSNSDVLQVVFSEGFKNGQYAIFNFDGSHMRQGKIHDLNMSIHIDNWASGSYFIKVESKKGIITKKFVVNN